MRETFSFSKILEKINLEDFILSQAGGSQVILGVFQGFCVHFRKTFFKQRV